MGYWVLGQGHGPRRWTWDQWSGHWTFVQDLGPEDPLGLVDLGPVGPTVGSWTSKHRPKHRPSRVDLDLLGSWARPFGSRPDPLGLVLDLWAKP